MSSYRVYNPAPNNGEQFTECFSWEEAEAKARQYQNWYGDNVTVRCFEDGKYIHYYTLVFGKFISM